MQCTPYDVDKRTVWMLIQHCSFAMNG